MSDFLIHRFEQKTNLPSFRYQSGPDTYLLPHRDVDFPLRIREYLRVGASRSPSLANNLRMSHWGDPNVRNITFKSRMISFGSIVLSLCIFTSVLHMLFGVIDEIGSASCATTSQCIAEFRVPR